MYLEQWSFMAKTSKKNQKSSSTNSITDKNDAIGKSKRTRKSVPRESPQQRSSIYRGVTRWKCYRKKTCLLDSFIIFPTFWSRHGFEILFRFRVRSQNVDFVRKNSPNLYTLVTDFISNGWYLISGTGGLVVMKLIYGIRIAGTSLKIRKEDKVN